jgi:hypothetical protein
MAGDNPRITREKKTVEHMIRLYCRGNHGISGEFCDDCSELLTYARERLDECPFGEKKKTCAKCPVHCYDSGKRDEIRRVMRYSGPRMLPRHPWLAIMHIIDGLRK